MSKEKPRPKRTGSVYFHAKAKMWCGQVDLGFIDGKRRRKTIYGPTEKATQTEVNKLRRQLDEHGTLPTSDRTVKQWLELWLTEHAKERLKPNTYRSYVTAVNEHIVPAIGDVKLSKLTAPHVRGMRKYLVETKKRSSTTARNAHRILSVALNDAVRDGIVPTNIVSKVRAPAKAVSKRTGMTGEQAIQLLTSVPDTRWLFALLTGTRQGERLGLRWSYLDLDLGSADLAWALQRVSYSHGCGEAEPGHTKRSCPKRVLAIPDGMEYERLDPSRNLILMRPKTEGSQRVTALIEPLRLALLALREQSAPSPFDLVWTDAGQPIDPRRDWQDWKDALKAAGLPDVAQHVTRHTTATLLLELGATPKVVEEIMGWSSAAMSKVYQHVSLDLQRRELGKLGDRLQLT